MGLITICADRFGMTVFVSEGTGSIMDGGVSAGLFPTSSEVETDGDDDVDR